MSLTDQLKDSRSPLRVFVDGISPWLSAETPAKVREQNRALGFARIASEPVLAPAPAAVDVTIAGHAIDYRARMALGSVNPLATTAAAGVELLPQLAHTVANGRHRAQVLQEIFAIAEGLLGPAPSSDQLDLASLLLAYCEPIARVGRAAFNSHLGTLLDSVSSGEDFAQRITADALSDIAAMMEVNRQQFSVWRAEIVSGGFYEPNPEFSGAQQIGGADGDWIVGDTLFDCKAYGEVTTTKIRAFIRQLLGYVLLDGDDDFRIRRIGVWLPRSGRTVIWSLDDVLGGEADALLPRLRLEAKKAFRRSGLAARESIGEEEKHRLMADNRHAPFETLEQYGRDDDAELRFRAARNPVTPETTVRLLVDDRLAHVRGGVARNPRAPEDILRRLASDSSIKVRAAVARNPSTPADVVRLLSKDDSPTVQRAASEWRRWSSHRTLTWSDDSDGLAVLEAQSEVGVGTVSSRGDGSGSAIFAGHRRDTSLDSQIVSWVLQRLLGQATEASGWSSFSGVPLASRVWGYQGREFVAVPALAASGDIEGLRDDLMRPERPAYLRRSVARSMPLSDPDVRQRLLADSDPWVRWLVIDDARAYEDMGVSNLLGELAASRAARRDYYFLAPAMGDNHDVFVTAAVAAHPRTPDASLQLLAESRDPHVQVGLLTNPSLSDAIRAQVTEQMLATRSLAAREAYARAVSAPVVVLKSLSSSNSPQVRSALASNLSTPVDILDALAHDSDWTVQLEVLRNPAASNLSAMHAALALLQSSADEVLIDTLAAIDRRTDLEVPRTTLVKAVARLMTWAKRSTGADELREYVARSPYADEKALRWLAENGDSSVRRSVAEHKAVGRDLLEAFLEDPDSAVQRIAKSRLMPEDPDENAKPASGSRPPAVSPDRPSLDDLYEMANSKRAADREQAALDPGSPPGLLANLAGERRSKRVPRAVAAHSNAPAEVLWSLFAAEDTDIHQSLALNPAAPPALLARLATENVDNALLVALNPGASDDVLEVLALDDEMVVRLLAREILEARRRAITSDSSAMPEGLTS